MIFWLALILQGIVMLFLLAGIWINYTRYQELHRNLLQHRIKLETTLGRLEGTLAEMREHQAMDQEQVVNQVSRTEKCIE